MLRLQRVLKSCGSAVAGLPYQVEVRMTDSVYKVIELVGSSSESWEKAAAKCRRDRL